MARIVEWSEFTDVEDIAVRLEPFLASISKPDPKTGCCSSNSKSKHNQGYPMLHALWSEDRGLDNPGRKKMVTGHRVLARLKVKRPITPQDKVYHTCGNMACCNIDHIEVGTMADVGGNQYKLSTNTDMMKRLGRKLTVVELKWLKNHTIDECMERWPELSRGMIWQMHHGIFKKNQLRWIERYDDNGNLLP